MVYVRLLHWIISLTAPTMNFDGLDRHQVIPYWERPLLKLRNYQDWSQDKWLQVAVSGSSGLKLQYGESLPEENFGPPLEHFLHLETPRDLRRVPCWIWISRTPSWLEWVCEAQYRRKFELGGTLELIWGQLSDFNRWRNCGPEKWKTLPKIILAGRGSQAGIHTHFFNTSSVHFLLCHPVSVRSAFKTGIIWGHCYVWNTEIKESIEYLGKFPCCTLSNT